MAKLIIVLGLVVGIISCGQEQTSDSRFITYGQQDYWSDRQAIYELFLIAKVHEKSWQIAWLVDNTTCHGFTPFRDESLHPASNRIEKLTEDLIRQWLEPLADVADRDLVDTFQFKRLDADRLMPVIIKMMMSWDSLTTEDRQLIDQLNDFELAITFSCRRGEHGELGVATSGGIILYEVQVDGDDLSFQPGVLLHELGHLFGLVDTYVSGNVHQMESTGGSDHNVGQQPDSVMSGVNFGGLSEDDKRGLIWLYRYYHDESIEHTDCIFDDYESETVPSSHPDFSSGFRGCRPRAGQPAEPPPPPVDPPVDPPVEPPPSPPADDDDQVSEPPEKSEPHQLSRRQRIDLAKQLLAKMREQVSEQEIIKFINDNPEFVVNRYDLNNGYTVLHYALANSYAEVVEKLLDHHEIDVNRRAWNGDTPLHLATLEGYEAGIRALLDHPKIRVNAYKYVSGGRRIYVRDYAVAAGLDWLVQEIDRRLSIGN